jgi:hypothetical protein
VALHHRLADKGIFMHASDTFIEANGSPVCLLRHGLPLITPAVASAEPLTAPVSRHIIEMNGVEPKGVGRCLTTEGNGAIIGHIG